jgi:hypothetical protein
MYHEPENYEEIILSITQECLEAESSLGELLDETQPRTASRLQPTRPG